MRELKNVVHRDYILSDGDIALSCLQAPPPKTGVRGREIVPAPKGASLDEAERQVILATLQHCGGNKNEASRLLGVSLKTLSNRLNVYRAADDAPATEPASPVPTLAKS